MTLHHRLGRLIDAFRPADGPPPATLLAFFRWCLSGAWGGLTLAGIASALGGVADVVAAVLLGWVVDAIATGAWVEGLTGAWDGDEVTVGDGVLEVIGLVGHTPGSIALAFTGGDGVVHLFTGDSLFPGGPGRTNSPPATSAPRTPCISQPT